MGWLKKKLKKITKTVDPIGAKLRKSTGGSYGDPMNWYQSKPKAVVPYERPEAKGLTPDPGTGGPTVKLGGGGNYVQNPFAGQMAQAGALRNPQMAPSMAAATAPAPPTGSAPTSPMGGMANNLMGQVINGAAPTARPMNQMANNVMGQAIGGAAPMSGVPGMKQNQMFQPSTQGQKIPMMGF